MVGHVVGPRSHGRGRRHPRRRGRRLHRARRRPGRARGPQRRRQDLAPQGGGGHGRAEGRGDPAPGAVRLPAAGPPARPHPAHPVRPRPRPRRPRPRRAGRAARGAAPQDGGAARATSAWWPSGAGPTTPSSTPAATRPSPRPRRLLAGLGLCGDRPERPITVLSGGERRRAELARILFAGSDLLMLDEPTNHLDNDARDWLLDFLRAYRGALIVISHDLELLDESITRVLHLDRPGEADIGELTDYKGTYSQYKAARERDEARLAKIAARQQTEIARLQTLVDRWGAKASKAAFAKSLETRIERIRSEGVEAPTRPARPPAPPARPAPVGPHRGHRPRPGQELRRRALRLPTTCPSRSAGASACSCSGSTARGRRACCASWRARPRPTAAASSGGTRSASATTRRSTRASAPAPRSSTTWTRPRPGSPPRSAGGCSACSA